MAQTFGVLGFLFALLALFFASEVMRRASHKQAILEQALFKATTRIQQIENKMAQVDRLATEVRYERKRQAETINALVQKGDLKTAKAAAAAAAAAAAPREPAPRESAMDRFTPSSHKARRTG